MWPVPPGRDALNGRLHLAYAEFTAWTKANRVPCLATDEHHQ